MDASEHATRLAIAISDGIDCLAYLRSLRAAPPVVSAVELEEWSGIFARAQSAFAELQAGSQAGKAQTSMRLTSELLLSFADVRAHLSEIAPNTQLPATLFGLVEVALSEVAKS